MATLGEVRTAIKNTIQNVFNDRGIDAYGYDYVPDVQESPAFVVMVSPEREAARFGKSNAMHSDEWDFWIMVMVSINDDSMSQALLDEFVSGKGDRSIRQILFENDEVGLDDGTIVHVTGVRAYGAERKVSNVPYVGAAITVTAYISDD